MRSARQHRMAALVLALLGLLAVVVGEAENLGAPEEQHDPAQDCMMAVLSPDEDAVYDGQAPPFEITLSTGCDCPPEGRVYHVEIRVSRESNKRHLNASTPFHCKQLQNEGAILDMLDLRDGRWEGYVAIHALSLSIPVRFSYVTESRPQAPPPQTTPDRPLPRQPPPPPACLPAHAACSTADHRPPPPPELRVRRGRGPCHRGARLGHLGPPGAAARDRRAHHRQRQVR